MTEEPVKIKRVSIKEADTLLTFSKNVFFAAFAHQNDPADMRAYADKAFTLQKLKDEINNENSEFYFAYAESAIAGYLKLNFKTAQTDFQGDDAMEVERIYVSADLQNKKVGQQLLNFALDQAVKHQMKEVWLGVWEHNHKAIRFYERNGFVKFGSHNFMLGNDQQTDMLLKRPV